MTEIQWCQCLEPGRMLALLVKKASRRSLRLFAIHCYLGLAEDVEGARDWNPVPVAQQHAGDLKTDWELCLAEEEAYDRLAGLSHGRIPRWAVARWELLSESAFTAANGVSVLCLAEAEAQGRRLQEQQRQVELLRELVAYPFHPPRVGPSWLTTSVKSLAQAITEEQSFEIMPILGDALQEAGCDDEQIIEHCYQTTPHLKECWLLDRLLSAMGLSEKCRAMHPVSS